MIQETINNFSHYKTMITNKVLRTPPQEGPLQSRPPSSSVAGAGPTPVGSAATRAKREGMGREGKVPQAQEGCCADAGSREVPHMQLLV